MGPQMQGGARSKGSPWAQHGEGAERWYRRKSSRLRVRALTAIKSHKKKVMIPGGIGGKEGRKGDVTLLIIKLLVKSVPGEGKTGDTGGRPGTD